MSSDIRLLTMLDRQLHQAHRNAISAELAARGLSEIGHPLLLTILETSEGASEQRSCMAQRDLAEMLHISPPAVSNSLKSLEKGGYITREPGKDDARRIRVHLTDKGSRAVEGCREAFAVVTRRALDGISEKERSLIISIQQRMLKNLESRR